MPFWTQFQAASCLIFLMYNYYCGLCVDLGAVEWWCLQLTMGHDKSCGVFISAVICVVCHGILIGGRITLIRMCFCGRWVLQTCEEKINKNIEILNHFCVVTLCVDKVCEWTLLSSLELE